MPFLSNTGEAFASAFRAILESPCGRKPLVVRTVNDMELVNSRFRKLLYSEGIEITVCKDTDVKCVIVERFNRTLKSNLFKWFKWNNTYRCVDVLEKFVSGYNDPVHRAR